MTAMPDRRLHVFRPDLADIRLRGRVAAREFVAGRPGVIAAPVAGIHDSPDAASECISQALQGERIAIFDERDDWSWIQCDYDGYVGYIRTDESSTIPVEPTHMVGVQRTFAYDGPDLRHPVVAPLSMGSRLAITGQTVTRGTLYALTDHGSAVIASHLAPIGRREADYVEVAARFLETPYLWGGRSGFGVDCSGLVQLAMMMAGMRAPRDTDMQAAGIGGTLDPGADYGNLRRGDLVFWKGHVAILTDPRTILHASGHSMTGTSETLAEAVSRIAHLYGPPTGFRRPGLDQ